MFSFYCSLKKCIMVVWLVFFLTTFHIVRHCVSACQTQGLCPPVCALPRTRLPLLGTSHSFIYFRLGCHLVRCQLSTLHNRSHPSSSILSHTISTPFCSVVLQSTYCSWQPCIAYLFLDCPSTRTLDSLEQGLCSCVGPRRIIKYLLTE